MNNTEKRIAEIEARLRAATPGPWRVSENLAYEEGEKVAEVGLFDIASPPETAIDSTSTATFIANAPTDIKFLLAELRASQAAAESNESGWSERYSQSERANHAIREERDAALAECTKQISVREYATDSYRAAKAQLAEAIEHIERMASEGVSRACGDDEAYAFLEKIKRK